MAKEVSSATLVVVGLGYVGLPLAMRAVEVGYRVVGLELDPARVASLSRAESYVEDISDAELKSAIATGRFAASADYEEAAGFDIAVITVPTPLRESLPDLSYIESAGKSLAKQLSTGATVILESTTYPGTTEELLVPILEKGSGLKAGKDFFAGYSPERIDPGNTTWNFQNTPKVISGINKASLDKVDEFYSSLVDRTVPVSTPKEAELAKLVENTFRHVNIALVNELAVFAHALGVNVWEAIDAAATKPFGFMKFTPGPGVGGHCLPVDPSYLSWQVRRTLGQSFRFVELANDVNEHMPNYVVQRAIELLNDQSRALRGSKVLVAGVAYKKNSGDVRESPSLRIIELLRGLGAAVSAADPLVSNYRWPAETPRVEWSSKAVNESDLVILVTDHDAFDLSILEETSTPVLDTRNRVQGNAATSL